jgi:hypothetical protein
LVAGGVSGLGVLIVHSPSGFGKPCTKQVSIM